MSQTLLVSGVSFLFSCRYLAVSSLTILLWDGILMLRRERQSLRKINNTVLRMAFACNRLSAIIMLIPWFQEMFPAVNLDNASCVRGGAAAGVIYVAANTLGNLSVAARLFLVWNKNSRTLRYLIAGATAAFFCNTALVIYSNRSAPGQLVWVTAPGLRSCITLDLNTPYLPVAYTVDLLFDIYASFMVFFNAMDIPRTENSQIIELLHRQGLWLLALILGLRVVNIMLSVIPGESYWVVGIIYVVPLIAILNTRLIVKACEFDEEMRCGCIIRTEAKEVVATSLSKSRILAPIPAVIVKIPKVFSFGRHPLENPV